MLTAQIEGGLEVKIFDISGKFIGDVKDKWDGKNRIGIEVKPGIYFLKAQGCCVKKVVKLR